MALECQAAETLEQLVKKWRMVSGSTRGRQGRQADEACRGGRCIPVRQVCRDSQEVRPGKGLQVDYEEESGQRVTLANGEEDREDKREVLEKKRGRGLFVQGGDPASYTAADCFIRTAMKRRVHRLLKYAVH